MKIMLVSHACLLNTLMDPSQSFSSLLSNRTGWSGVLPSPIEWDKHRMESPYVELLGTELCHKKSTFVG